MKTDLQKKLELSTAILENFNLIDRELKHYGLLSEDSLAFAQRAFQYNHLDLELPEGTTHEERVSLWFDFITTICVDYEVEPQFLTDSGAIHNVGLLIQTLQGSSLEDCDHCDGQGSDISGDTCPHCLGLSIKNKVDLR
jgi:hypothetical protein